MIAKHLTIHGHVQGVYYRAWTIQTATKLGLTGWVRNRRDGTVEALVMGDAETINQLISACRNGPPAAHVKHIDIEDADPEPLETFEQRATL